MLDNRKAASYVLGRMIELAALVLILALGVVAAFLVRRLHKSSRNIKCLEESKKSLLAEKSRQSNQLRLKGIEIDKLKRELDKYSDTEIKVALTGQEKLMLMNALNMSQFKSKVEEPATKFFIRQIYRDLKEKIKESIKE
jgi:hypothetical protein